MYRAPSPSDESDNNAACLLSQAVRKKSKVSWQVALYQQVHASQ